MVLGDRYGLVQVFLNLVRNSMHAVQDLDTKRLTIRSVVESNCVVVYFEDTGTGIADPEGLFKPFYQSSEGSGLGLYVSRAILRSFRGELEYRPQERGCGFAVILTTFALSHRA